jgi:hypothetical protein
MIERIGFAGETLFAGPGTKPYGHPSPGRSSNCRTAETSDLHVVGGRILWMSYWGRAGTWARQHTKTFTVIKAIPSVLAAIAQYRFFGMRPMKETGFVILTLFGSYAVLYAIEFIGKILFLAPPALDKQAFENTALKRSELIQSHAEEVGRWYRGRIEIDSALADCKDRLARKHPHDEYKEGLVRKWMDDYSEQERACIQWLLDAGEVRNAELQAMFGPAIAKIQDTSHLISTRIIEVKGRSEWYLAINTSYLDALINFLHPNADKP